MPWLPNIQIASDWAVNRHEGLVCCLGSKGHGKPVFDQIECKCKLIVLCKVLISMEVNAAMNTSCFKQ